MKDFAEIGKRMPYAESEEYLEQLIQAATNKAIAKQKPQTRIRSLSMGATAAAAAIVLCIFITKLLPTSTTADDFASVELAYNNLSIEDQEYLLQIYEQDLFINDLNEDEP